MQQAFNLVNFIVVQNFVGFTTLLAGSVAWLVYISQKRDKKTNAAKVILSEIRLAEERVSEIRNLLARQQSNFPLVLPVNSWNTYSYLFASDFDQDQLEEINNFYNLCEVMTDAAKRDSNYAWLTSEAITQIGTNTAVELILKSLKKDLSFDETKFTKMKQSVLDNIPTHPFIYSPVKTINILSQSLNEIRAITTSTTGTKLKKLAQGKRFIFF